MTNKTGKPYELLELPVQAAFQVIVNQRDVLVPVRAPYPFAIDRQSTPGAACTSPKPRCAKSPALLTMLRAFPHVLLFKCVPNFGEGQVSFTHQAYG